MYRRLQISAVLAALPLGLFGQAPVSSSLQSVPSAFNPGNADVRISAGWTQREVADAPSRHPLILQISDTVAYPPGASANAVVTPAEGLKVTQLAFDHQLGSHCTNGSPRWDV